MTSKVTFRPYRVSDLQTCLDIFDANCPEYFAPNERADYEEFLSACPEGYELCEESGIVMGAFGIFDIDADANAKALNWILLDPNSQGQGIGSSIMERTSGLARAAGASVLHIATSQKAKWFFAKFGAEVILVTEHGWGTDMHRVDMALYL
jgi:GNAT superfamily N-acetyltransferase